MAADRWDWTTIPPINSLALSATLPPLPTLRDKDISIFPTAFKQIQVIYTYPYTHFDIYTTKEIKYTIEEL